MDKIFLRKAGIVNCEEIYNIQVEAFHELLNKYKDYDTNPAAETIENTEQRMKQKNTDYYFITLDDDNIGAIRIVRLDNNTCRISSIFIVPQFQNMGYGQQAIYEVESLYPKTEHWELDTIKEESRLCHFYKKMGYSETGEEKTIQSGMTSIYYGK